MFWIALIIALQLLGLLFMLGTFNYISNNLVDDIMKELDEK